MTFNISFTSSVQKGHYPPGNRHAWLRPGNNLSVVSSVPVVSRWWLAGGNDLDIGHF